MFELVVLHVCKQVFVLDGPISKNCSKYIYDTKLTIAPLYTIYIKEWHMWA